MTTPTIAAVIVNHNYARFVTEAVRSVLAQRTPFDEVIVVDDGSTDDSPEVLAAVAAADDRVRVLAIANRGQLGACRAGLDAATADYVYFLDADDYTRPHLVETVRPALGGGGPVKLQFQLEGVSDTGGELESVFPSYPDGYGAAAMRADNSSIGFYICPPTSGNVYSRRALQALPLDRVDQRDFIDGPPTLALPYHGEVVSLREPLACYRLHGNNHSQWSEPTAELLTHEIEWFTRRWEQAGRLLDGADPRRGDRPMYVAERELMIAALAPRGRTPVRAVRLIRTLLPTNLPGRQKLMITGWALGLTLPSARLRRNLVRARRSPLNRSNSLRRLVRLGVRGRRHTATTASRAPATNG